jgi:hypothetical protein
MTGCGIYCAVLFLKLKEQVWFLLACFYAAFALGLLYWLLFLVFRSGTPKFSLVSDLSWLASLLFLLALQTTIRLPGEKDYRPPWAWSVPVFCAVMCLYFFRWGDYFINILWAVLMGACGYDALRGLLFTQHQRGAALKHQYFHIAILAFILLEYCLWLASCIWTNNTVLNPYYLFDFLLSVTFFTFVPTLKKVVLK